MSERRFQVLMLFAAAAVGVSFGTINDTWFGLVDKTNNAATKQDIAEVMDKIAEVAEIGVEVRLLRKDVKANTDNVAGLEARQRVTWNTVVRMCERQDMVCSMTNASFWLPAVLRLPVPLPPPSPKVTQALALVSNKRADP